MGRPYSLDLRERVVTAMTAGMSGREAAKHFSIGASSALRWARGARNRQSEGQADGGHAAVRAGGPPPLDYRPIG